MRFFTLILLLANAAYAGDMRTNVLIGSLASVAFILIVLIVWQKLRLRVKDQDLINILEQEDSSTIYRDKTALNYDLQEIFLYFFKTLAYEASINNNTFLVRQKMLVRSASELKQMLEPIQSAAASEANKIRPNFLPERSSAKDLSENLSQQNIDPKRQLNRPVRHFFGDYTEVINAIYGCADLLASACSNRTIAIDIEQLSGPDNQILLNVEVSICEPQNDEIAQIFKELASPKEASMLDKISKFQNTINKITGAKYFIKDNTTRINYTIALSMPLVVANYNQPHEVAPNIVLKALVVHDNKDIASIIINNLNDFNIECIYNQSAAGLVSLASDGVNFPYRAVIIDAMAFAMLSLNEQEQLMTARSDNNFELIIVLNNYKAASLIRPDLASSLFFLPLPYTIDNIRAVVTAIINQHESLLK